GKFDEWKAGLMKQLRERSFRTLPNRVDAAKLEKSIGNGVAEDLSSEPGVVFRVVPITFTPEPVKMGTLVVFNPDEDLFQAFEKGWAKPFSDEKSSIAIYPRGGEYPWTRK